MNEREKLNCVELPACDLPATKAFFEQAFGWSFVDYGPVFRGGRRFHFTKPSGNEFAVWSEVSSR